MRGRCPARVCARMHKRVRARVRRDCRLVRNRTTAPPTGCTGPSVTPAVCRDAEREPQPPATTTQASASPCPWRCEHAASRAPVVDRSVRPSSALWAPVFAAETSGAGVERILARTSLLMIHPVVRSIILSCCGHSSAGSDDWNGAETCADRPSRDQSFPSLPLPSRSQAQVRATI